jgi:hypothetical protein
MFYTNTRSPVKLFSRKYARHMPLSRLRRWWHRVNRRFEPTYGTASRQNAKNDNTALPGFPPDSKTYETDSDPSARRG